MSEVCLFFASALWLGILTSISPCPLATNVAAISFLSKKIIHPRRVFFSGLAYTLGRILVYVFLGTIILTSLLSVSVLANFLQNYMNKIFGFILVFTGLVLLDALKLKIFRLSVSSQQQEKLSGSGVIGAFVLGMIFALVFCPVSSALFFGSLIPLALKYKPGTMLIFVYGLGTGLPVLLFALAIAFGVKTLSHWLKRLSGLEYYMRKITGVIFVLVGLFYIGVYSLKVGGLR
jgi:cytochrome c biogenesis protein CcdA